MSFEQEFIRGFIDGAPGNYDHAADTRTDAPWCAPWLCYAVDYEDWFRPELDPYYMGMGYAQSVYDALEAAFEQKEI